MPAGTCYASEQSPQRWPEGGRGNADGRRRARAIGDADTRKADTPTGCAAGAGMLGPGLPRRAAAKDRRGGC